MPNTSHQPPAARGWLLLVYRVPSEPSNNRVSVWRDLKRFGALYLQQCVCVLPRRRDLRKALAGVREKIAKAGGSSNLFEIPRLPPEEDEALAAGFRDLAAKHYAEIVEECETKFVKEIEFEKFRQNYTFAEAEEIAQDLEKIRGWFARAQEHDWFGAPGRAGVSQWITRCEKLLEDFYGEVHARAGPWPITLGRAHSGAPRDSAGQGHSHGPLLRASTGSRGAAAAHASGPDAAELDGDGDVPPAAATEDKKRSRTK